MEKEYTRDQVNKIVRSRIERVNQRMEQLETDNIILQFKLDEMRKNQNDTRLENL